MVRHLGILAFLLGGVGSASAQYQIFSWESFENGRLPEKLTMGHFADNETVVVGDYTVAGVPRETFAGPAASEVGRFGLFFRPLPKKMHLSVFSQDGLNRQRLGAHGRALYQADFFIPAEGQPIPSFSLLAQVLQDGKTNYKFYRFGVEEGRGRIFFSFVNDTPQPVIFHSQKLDEFNLKRPGWHRFQIIFEGQSQIICAIDAQPTSFSPIQEPTHTVLNAGIMVTSAKFDAIAMADNLSIQWTDQDVPIPVSPWVRMLDAVDATQTSALDTGPILTWHEDSAVAWRQASIQNRPILAMFYTNRIGPYEYLKSIVPNNDNTYADFAPYILLKIDANQLAGGRLAERFQIYRLPTFVAMGSDAKERGRLVVTNRQTRWEEIQAFLKQSSVAPATPTPAPDAPEAAAPGAEVSVNR